MGPNLLWHIGGGKGGIHHFMETLMDPMFALMKDLGNPQMTTELKQTIIGGVMEEAGNRSVEELAQRKTRCYSDYLACVLEAPLRLCRPKGVAKRRWRLDGAYDMRRIPSQLRKYFQKNFRFYVSYSKLIY